MPVGVNLLALTSMGNGMRALLIAASLLFAIAPAYAGPPNFDEGGKKEGDKKLEAARQAEQDRAYKSSLQRIPAKETVSDPWGTVRPDNNLSPQSRSKKP